MTSLVSISNILTSDEIDDLIYDARAGDLASLKENVTSLGHQKACPISVILRGTIDIDEDGLGSGSSLLHYPAANGNLEVVEYLLSHAVDDNEPQEKLQPALEGLQANGATSGYARFVNHQNVSGNTPLHWAGVNGHLAVVKALMKAGADPGIINGAGRDAVFESDVSSKEGAAECAVEMLKVYEGLEKSSEMANGDAKEEGAGSEKD